MLKTIKTFMWVALTLAVLSATSSFVEGFYTNRLLHDTKEKEVKTNTLVVATANSIASEISVLNKLHSYVGSTGTVGKGGGGGGIPGTVHEPYLLEMKISPEEYNYKTLKQAVFLSIKYCGADSVVLKEALNILIKRGYEIYDDSINKVLSEFDEILALRFQWLDKEVIPNFQRKIDDFPPQVQSEPYAAMVIPEDIWMFPDYGEDILPPSVQIDLTEIELYRAELALLKQQIN